MYGVSIRKLACSTLRDVPSNSQTHSSFKRQILPSRFLKPCVFPGLTQTRLRLILLWRNIFSPLHILSPATTYAGTSGTLSPENIYHYFPNSVTLRFSEQAKIFTVRFLNRYRLISKIN